MDSSRYSHIFMYIVEQINDSCNRNVSESDFEVKKKKKG